MFWRREWFGDELGNKISRFPELVYIHNVLFCWYIVLEPLTENLLPRPLHVLPDIFVNFAINIKYEYGFNCYAMLYPYLLYISGYFPKKKRADNYPVHNINFKSFQFIFSREGTMTSYFFIDDVTSDGTEGVISMMFPTSWIYWDMGTYVAGGRGFTTTADNYCWWRVPYFGGRFWPIFWQENMSYQWRMLEHCYMKIVRTSSTCVYVLKYSISRFVFCLNYYCSIYWLTTLKII